MGSTERPEEGEDMDRIELGAEYMYCPAYVRGSITRPYRVRVEAVTPAGRVRVRTPSGAVRVVSADRLRAAEGATK